jgi:hypothetical protein
VTAKKPASPQNRSLQLRGNLNGAKAAGRAAAFWRRRALRAQDGWVKSLIAEYTQQRIDELGGAESITAGQRSVIETAAACRGVIALLFAGTAADGGILRQTPDGLDLVPAMKALPAFLGRLLAAEETLGLSRTQKTAITLKDIKAQISSAKEAVIDVEPEPAA